MFCCCCFSHAPPLPETDTWTTHAFRVSCHLPSVLPQVVPVYFLCGILPLRVWSVLVPFCQSQPGAHPSVSCSRRDCRNSLCIHISLATPSVSTQISTETSSLDRAGISRIHIVGGSSWSVSVFPLVAAGSCSHSNPLSPFDTHDSHSFTNAASLSETTLPPLQKASCNQSSNRPSAAWKRLGQAPPAGSTPETRVILLRPP